MRSFRLVGCTRFESSTTSSSLTGSIHNDVPVYPRWPNDSGENNVPDEDGADGVSHPKAQLESGTLCCRAVKHRTNSGSNNPAFPRRPFIQACATASTARAVPNNPAWPATPPSAKAFSSWTSPRNVRPRQGSSSVGAIASVDPDGGASIESGPHGR